MKVDFFARRSHFVDHLASVYRAMEAGRRGAFYVPEGLAAYAESKGLEVVGLKSPSRNDPIRVAPPGDGPLVVCAYGDLQLAHQRNGRRKFIFMEHGVGITFAHPGYAGGLGLRRKVSLFLAPNEFIRAKTAKTLPGVRQEVVGTPKMDAWAVGSRQLGVEGEGLDGGMVERRKRKEGKPVVCVAFHWDGRAVAPEAGNALGHYRGALRELAENGARGPRPYTLIGHGHPRIIEELRPVYERAGMETVTDFEEVLERADVYVNDCSSTLYEFCVTGKPVVILNAPWYRRNVEHGIRFWAYSDVGPQVDEAEELLPVIREQLAVISGKWKVESGQNAGPSTARVRSAQGDKWEEARERAVRELYPYLGHAAERAAEVIGEYASEQGAGAGPFDGAQGRLGSPAQREDPPAAVAASPQMGTFRGRGAEA